MGHFFVLEEGKQHAPSRPCKHAQSPALDLLLVALQYREDEGYPYPSNIMFDRRVVRGNTYAARILPADVSLTDKKTTSTT